jgi:uncharacterized protein involved in exopolysaccharide biosynthesis
MAEQENKTDTGKQALTIEQRLNLLIEKFRPYFLRLWQLRKKMILVNFIVAVLLLVYLYLIAKPYFESSVTILPEYGNKSTTLSNLSQLAALAGVRVGEGAPTDIYQNLIYSESVLENVIYHKYETEKYDIPVDLVQYFLDDDSLSYSKRKNFLRLYKSFSESVVRSNVERMTRILTITVSMPESKLSADVANQIAESLDLFVRSKRKTYASEQKYYLEKRTVQLKDSLEFVEEKLRSFREQNRVVLQSPKLMLEQARLMRDVEILNAVYIELNKQLEIAKIDDIRETPIVNIKEWAKDPIIKAGPKRVKAFMIIMFLSVITSSMYYLFQPQLKKYFQVLKGISRHSNPND